jgi:hypothetical protein
MYQTCTVYTEFAAETLGGLAMPSGCFELMNFHKIPNLIVDMKNKGLDCLGHVIRIVQTRVIRKLPDSRAEVRLAGRCGELKVKRWRHKANIREE